MNGILIEVQSAKKASFGSLCQEGVKKQTEKDENKMMMMIREIEC